MQRMPKPMRERALYDMSRFIQLTMRNTAAAHMAGGKWGDRNILALAGNCLVLLTRTMKGCRQM